MSREYVVIRDTERAKQGLIVYDCIRHDYGLANEDSRINQEEYGSYSFTEDGEYPFITIPKSALKETDVH